MRNITSFILLLVLSIGFVSCNQEQDKAAAQQKQDSLLQAQQDSLLDVFKGELELIQQTVKQVNANNGIFTLDTSENAVLSKESIINQVENLDKLLESNQKQLADLYERMRNSKVKNDELEKMLTSMQETLANRENQINELMTMLANKDMKIDQILSRVDSMRITNIELTEEVIKMDEEMHIVHYVVGEVKKLKESGIITKEGGLLGLGASKKLDVSQLDLSQFTEADQRDLKSIPLYSKKAKLITNHPESSYNFILDSEGKVESLSITDRKSFCAASDFLVVEVDN